MASPRTRLPNTPHPFQFFSKRRSDSRIRHFPQGKTRAVSTKIVGYKYPTYAPETPFSGCLSIPPQTKETPCPPLSPTPPNSPPPTRVSPKPCKPPSAKKSPAPSPPSTAVLTPKPPTRPSWICGARKRKTVKNAGMASASAHPPPAKKPPSPPKSISRSTASTVPYPAHSPKTKTAIFLFYTAANFTPRQNPRWQSPVFPILPRRNPHRRRRRKTRHLRPNRQPKRCRFPRQTRRIRAPNPSNQSRRQTRCGLIFSKP